VREEVWLGREGVLETLEAARKNTYLLDCIPEERKIDTYLQKKTDR
jgi:hypothetical protein